MKRLKISLTTPNSITKAVEYLNKYVEDLKNKSDILVQRLIDIGISTAKSNCGEFQGMIVFEKEMEDLGMGCLVATDGEKIISEWFRNGDLVSAEVSPLLMAEFGSGWLAQVYFPSVDGLVGQGTFPNQLHAFDPNGWRWTDKEGNRHHSYGTEPTHPMYSALLAMLLEVDAIAKEVFKNG